MEVILARDIDALGSIGDVIKVKDGYARNFLIPKKMVYAATKSNLKKIEIEKKHKTDEEEKRFSEAQGLAGKLSGTSCTVTVEVNDLEKLYGAVSEIDIAKALEADGHNIDKKDIVLEKPIEELGIFDVGIKLHPQVIAKIRVWVTKK